VGDLLAALASYSQRHFLRMDRLARSAFLLDYTLGAMRVYLGEDAADGASRGALPAESRQSPRNMVSDGDAGAQQGQEGRQQQQHRQSRMANGHARPHEQTNGNSHPGSASSSDAEFGGHDHEVLASAAQRADSPEPVHIGPEGAVSGQKHRAETAAEPQRVKRKRQNAEAGNTGNDAGVGDDDDGGGDEDEAEPAVGAEGVDDAEQPQGARNAVRKAAANRKKKQRKKRKAKATAAAAGGGGAGKLKTSDGGKARKARRSTRTPG
jgi:hypothetical protein